MQPNPNPLVVVNTSHSFCCQVSWPRTLRSFWGALGGQVCAPAGHGSRLSPVSPSSYSPCVRSQAEKAGQGDHPLQGWATYLEPPFKDTPESDSLLDRCRDLRLPTLSRQEGPCWGPVSCPLQAQISKLAVYSSFSSCLPPTLFSSPTFFASCLYCRKHL